MRTFEHFPENFKCLLCGTNEDKPCVLVGVNGTQEGNIEQALPVHVDCINLRYYRENNIVYQVCVTEESSHA